MNVSVFGLGKAGLPLAAVIARSGLSVTGVDLNTDLVEQINNGKNPIPEEAGLADILEKHGGKGLQATADASEALTTCTAHIVIVPLFIDDNHKPDFSILEQAFTSIGKGLKKGDLVVLETTVPPGTTENRIKGVLEKESSLVAGTDFHLAYSPERIMTGYSVSRFTEFPKLVSGLTNACLEKVHALYSQFANPIKVSSIRTAELTKVAEGVYRDVNIGLANELLKVSDEHGVDFWEMREAAKHEFCNILEPGNVGGHCIPVYPWFLINDLDVPLMKTSRELNDGMIAYYGEKIKAITSKGKVGVIGLSYREGVKEKAYSRSVAMIDHLKKEGYDVFGLDPLYTAEETEKEFDVSQLSSFDEMDALILMNKETSYMEELKQHKDKLVDVKNIVQ